MAIGSSLQMIHYRLAASLILAEVSFRSSDRFRERLAPYFTPVSMPLSFRFVNTFFSVSAGLVGVMALVFGSYALYWHYAAKVPTSPIVLYASHDSGVGGTTVGLSSGRHLSLRERGVYRFRCGHGSLHANRWFAYCGLRSRFS